MVTTFDLCLKKEHLVQVPIDDALVKKERDDAELNLRYAKQYYNEENDKRAIIYGYYAIIHALRGPVLKQGYRAKTPTCLRQAVDALFVVKGKLHPILLDGLEFATEIRDGVDLGYLFNREDARELVTIAEHIVELTKPLT